jgi:hypothetical protein
MCAHARSPTNRLTRFSVRGASQTLSCTLSIPHTHTVFTVTHTFARSWLRRSTKRSAQRRLSRRLRLWRCRRMRCRRLRRRRRSTKPTWARQRPWGSAPAQTMRSMRRRPPGKGRAGAHRTTCECRGRGIKLSSEIGVVFKGRRERPFRGERPWSPWPSWARPVESTASRGRA